MAAFGNWLKTGFGIDIAGRLNSALMRIPAALQQAIETGIRFNSTLEDSELGIAGLLRAIAPERFASLDAALAASQGMMRDLRKEAETTAATFGQLVEASQGLMGPAMTAGIPLEKMAKLASMIARTVGTVMPGAPGYQIMQEGRALLTGDIGPAAFVAKSIPGITKQGIDEATRSGRLFEFLEEKLGAFNEAAERSGGTFTVLLSNLTDAFEGVSADATKGLFVDLKEFIRDLTTLVRSPVFREALGNLGTAAGLAARGLSAGAGWAASTYNASVEGISNVAEHMRLKLALAIGQKTTAEYLADIAYLGKLNALNGAAGGVEPDTGSPVVAGGPRSTQHWGTIGMGGPRRLGSPVAGDLAELVKSLQFSAPKSGLSASGLYLTRAEAYMQRQGLSLQRTMVDELRRIREVLTGKGLTLEW